jgi:hypothetical protein
LTYADGTAVLVRAVVDARDPAHLGSRALGHVEAAMALVLRGETDAGHDALLNWSPRRQALVVTVR